jgi:hypothetical protein
MPEALPSATHPALQTREARIARSNATYPKALRAATNGTSAFTVGPKMQGAPPEVFLTVIQKDGSFKAIDRL